MSPQVEQAEPTDGPTRAEQDLGLRAILAADGKTSATDVLLHSAVRELRHLRVDFRNDMTQFRTELRADLRMWLVALVILAALGITVSAGVVGIGLSLRAGPAELRTTVNIDDDNNANTAARP